MATTEYTNAAYEPEGDAATTLRSSDRNSSIVSWTSPVASDRNSSVVYLPTAVVTQQPTVYIVPATAIQVLPNSSTSVVIEETKQTETKPPVNVCCSIFKRLFSAFFIIVDALMDWLSFGEMNEGVSQDIGSFNKTTKSLDFSMPDLKDTWNKVSSIKKAFSGSGSLDCEGKTLLLTILYGFLLFLGSAYGLFQLINMIGETLFEINSVKEDGNKGDGKEENGKRNLCRGFQILHGWTETFFALWLEDIPQGLILLFFSDSCRKNALNSIKTTFTVVIPFLKNTTRKLTSKQQRRRFIRCGDGCSIWRERIGLCPACCPQWTCYDWIWCACCHAPIEKEEEVKNGDETKVVTTLRPTEDCTCCKFIPRVWGCMLRFPPVCTCCSVTLCYQRGFCQQKFDSRECCKPRWHHCCFDEIAHDPEYIEKFIWLGQLIYAIVFVLYILVKFFGVDLMSILKPVWSVIRGVFCVFFGCSLD